MHVSAHLAGQEADVEVGEDCRTLQALKEAIVKSLPQLYVEGFDVSVGGRILDDDEGVVTLEESACLDVSANSRGLSVLALRDAGHEVSEAGLFAAAEEGNVERCTLYLDAGVPLHCENCHGRTPFFIACLGRIGGEGGNPELCQFLLDRGHRDIQHTDVDGDTPLHAAATYGYLAICEFLLNRGHAVQCEAHDGRTPLHNAVSSANQNICKLLLDRGHDVQCETRGGWTPLHSAMDADLPSIGALLLDRGHDVCPRSTASTPLHCAVVEYSPRCCRLLLERGHGIHCMNSRGDSPLAIAEKSHREIFELLSNWETTGEATGGSAGAEEGAGANEGSWRRRAAAFFGWVTGSVSSRG